MEKNDNYIEIEGAKVHNLKNINLKIPRVKLVVITGISGSGKSSLAFDTIYSEGQRRYLETFSAYVRQFLGNFDSKINLKNSVLRGLNIVTSLSNAPIRLANILASAAAILSFIYSIYVILVWILNENVVPGWVSLSMQISILFFMNSLVLILMSEYILRIGKRNNKSSTYYIIDEITSINITRKGKLNIESGK